jgi:hypothetical protein
MNAKNIITTICGALTLSLVTSSGAYAATGQKVYSSGILVLVFLGFVALVVVVQLIPAIITVIGMVKSLVHNRKTTTAKVTSR